MLQVFTSLSTDRKQLTTKDRGKWKITKKIKVILTCFKQTSEEYQEPDEIKEA